MQLLRGGPGTKEVHGPLRMLALLEDQFPSYLEFHLMLRKESEKENRFAMNHFLNIWLILAQKTWLSLEFQIP